MTANPSRDEGTPRPWNPPVVIGDFCLRCGATLDPGRDFDNHGPCSRDEHPAEVAWQRMLAIEAAAREVVAGPPRLREWASITRLREALDPS